MTASPRTEHQHQSSGLHAVIVGGSLSGLMTALALTRVGASVTVLERAGRERRSGAALAVSPADLSMVLGAEAADVVLSRLFGPGVRPSSGQSIAWEDLHQTLLTALRADPRARIHHASPVAGVHQEAERAWVVTEEGQQHQGDLVIGADGHRSIVRRAVDPDHPDARFAGYLLWVGVASEADLGHIRSWPRGLDIHSAGQDYLLGYPLPATDGTLTPGRRRLGWAIYDAGRNRLLRESGAVQDGIVQHSIRSRDIPEAVYGALDSRARRQWPSPWAEAITDSVARRAVTGTPIAEYVPERLASGRLALVGNAAHVPTPMTGSGFAASLEDAFALATVLQDTEAADVPDALEEYERRRLDPARDLVQSGQSFSRAFAGR